LSNGVFSKLGLEKNFAAVKDLGFENVKFNMKCVRRENDVAVYGVQKLMDAYGLNCLTVHSATLHVKDEVEVHRAVYYGKISLEFARKLNVSIMTVHSNVSKKLPQKIRNQCLEQIFNELNNYAKSLNIKLALENLSYTSTGFGKNVDQLEEVLKIVDDDEMGITLDFCHALETKEADTLLEKYHERICNIHMANKAHEPFTQETAELTSFLAKLHGYGYEGPITLELKQKTPIEEILKTKALFLKLLRNL
jgi:sugar phosphate isomerase/epimerase